MKKLLLSIGLCTLAPQASFADILTLQAFGFAGGQVVRYDELTGVQVPGWSFNPQGVNPAVFQLAGLEAHGGVGYVSSRDTGQILQFNLETGAPVGSGVFANVPIEPDDPRLMQDPNATANPTALRVGPDGLLYVADGSGSSVLRYNLETGALVDRFVEDLSGVGGLGFTTGGSLLAASNTFGAGPNAVYSGGGAPPTVLTSGLSQIEAPNSILVNSDGSFLVIDVFPAPEFSDINPSLEVFADFIFKYAADGSFLGNIAEIPEPTDIDDMNLPVGATKKSNFPSDMRFDAEGNVLVVTLGVSSSVQGASKNYGSILRFAPDGGLIERLADSLFAPSAIALVNGLTGTPGDFNRDGNVDAADYTMWKTGFGRVVTPGSNADGNFDGAIDAADYTVWRDNLTVGVAAGAAGVPEPASAMLALTVLLACFGYRSRRVC